MTVQEKRFPLKFEKVTFIPYEEWPEDWLSDSDPGDLLLGPDKTYGILCIANGAFLNVTPDQIYRQHEIPWPDHVGQIKEVKLIGNTIKIGT